jgi:polyisoprenoid-binding protein YceI
MKRALLSLLFTVSLAAQQPEIFGIDRSHSYVGFTIGFLGMSKVRGTFNDYTGTILYDDAHPERSSITLLIHAASIDTRNEGRDKDLQAEAFFDVAKHPRILFRSTSIEHKRGDEYVVHGELTMKGVTRTITVPMTRTVRRTADAAWGNVRIGGVGRTTIRRKDFNIVGTQFWGDAVLSDDVTIEIDLLGNRPNYDKWKAQDEAGERRIAIHRHVQHGRPAEALELLAKALEASPNDAGLHARSGEAYVLLGKREDAIRAYEKALALDANNTEAMEMLRRMAR